MIYTFTCPHCGAELKTEHIFGAQVCPTCLRASFSFRDYDKGTIITPAESEPNPYAYFKREGE